MKTTDKVLTCIFATFEHEKHAKESLEKLESCDIEQWRPEEMEDGTELGEAEKIELQQEVRDHGQRRNKFEDNMHKAFGLILWQCIAMLAKALQDRLDWKTTEAK